MKTHIPVVQPYVHCGSVNHVKDGAPATSQGTCPQGRSTAHWPRDVQPPAVRTTSASASLIYVQNNSLPSHTLHSPIVPTCT